MSSIDAALSVTGQQLDSPWIMLSFVAELRRIQSVVDLGCGRAHWLHAARRLGALDLRGYDNSEIPLAERSLRPEEFRAADLSGPVDIGRRYDLAICLEVGAQLPAEAAATLVGNATAASDWVLFGAALPHQGGVGHVNENWLEYWARLFADRRYLCYDILRLRFWHEARIAYYYRQNTCLYVRRGAHHALEARGHTPVRVPPSLVHPEMLLATLARKAGCGPGHLENVRSYYLQAGYACVQPEPQSRREDEAGDPGGAGCGTE